MTTAPTPITAAPKVSWLKKLGQDILKVLGVVVKVEQVAEIPVEAILPASIPAFGVFDKVMQLVGVAESSFAAAGQASNGPAKLQSILAATGKILDQYVADNFPGSAEILKSEQYIAGKTTVATQYINSVVAFLNSIPAVVAPTTPTTNSVATLAAAQVAAANLAAKSSSVSVPAENAKVTESVSSEAPVVPPVSGHNQ